MVYIILADGFEEIETFGTIDILRRCGLEVATLSLTGKRNLTSARGIYMKVDGVFRKCSIRNCQAVILPGGLENAMTMNRHQALHNVLQSLSRSGTLIAAICAAPMALGTAELLNGVNATIYPGMQQYLKGAIYHKDMLVVEDGNIITGAGPGATALFAFQIARRILAADQQIVDKVEEDMLLKSDNSAKILQK